MQPSSASTLIFVQKVQLLSLWFLQQNIGYDIQWSTVVHYLYGQFRQPFLPTSLSPRQERLGMQSLVGFVIGVNQGWHSFEEAMQFQTSLYDIK